MHEITIPQNHGHLDQKYAKGNLSPISHLVPTVQTLKPFNEKPILPMPKNGIGPMRAPDINPDYNTPAMNFDNK